MRFEARSLVVAVFLVTPNCVVIPLSPAPPIPEALRGHGRGVRSLAFSADGRVLASMSHDGPVILWDVASLEPIRPPIAHNGIRAAALSRDGATLAVGHEDGTVMLWDARGRDQAGVALPGRQRDGVTSVAFSPDGVVLASGARDGTVVFRDVRRETEIARLAAQGEGVRRVVFSPDGSVIAVATSSAVVLYDAVTHRPIAPAPLKTRGGLEELAFSADGRWLARTGAGFSLFDVAGRRCVWGNEASCEIVDRSLDGRAGVAFSPDGRALAVGERGGDPIVELWSIESKRDIRRITMLRGHGGKRFGGASLLPSNASFSSGVITYIHAVAFSPDGRMLATGGDDHAIILWDVATMQPIEPAAWRLRQ